MVEQGSIFCCVLCLSVVLKQNITNDYLTKEVRFDFYRIAHFVVGSHICHNASDECAYVDVLVKQTCPMFACWCRRMPLLAHRHQNVSWHTPLSAHHTRTMRYFGFDANEMEGEQGDAQQLVYFGFSLFPARRSEFVGDLHVPDNARRKGMRTTWTEPRGPRWWTRSTRYGGTCTVALCDRCGAPWRCQITRGRENRR